MQMHPLRFSSHPAQKHLRLTALLALVIMALMCLVPPAVAGTHMQTVEQLMSTLGRVRLVVVLDKGLEQIPQTHAYQQSALVFNQLASQHQLQIVSANPNYGLYTVIAYAKPQLQALSLCEVCASWELDTQASAQLYASYPQPTPASDWQKFEIRRTHTELPTRTSTRLASR